MDAEDVIRKENESRQKPTLLFNPLKDDFTWKWGGVPYTLRSEEYTEFPKFLANHIGKHLIEK